MDEKIMKVFKYEKYGSPSVLYLDQLPIPVPNSSELLIKIESTTVTTGDVRLRASNFPPLLFIIGRLIFGVFKPKKQVLGHEFAGTVINCGSDVKKFQVGDRVYGTTSGLKAGSHAEYIVVPEEKKSCVIGKIPENISFNEASATPIGGMASLDLLLKGNIKDAKNVMVIGACGSVGSFAMQIAKLHGAEVTAVCSKDKHETAKKLGASQVIDYKTQKLDSANLKYDIIFDSTGKYKKSDLTPLLIEGGRFISTKSLTSEKNEYLEQLSTWLKEGKINPLIDRYFNFNQLPEAHQYVDEGHKSGAVIINIKED